MLINCLIGGVVLLCGGFAFFYIKLNKRKNKACKELITLNDELQKVHALCETLKTQKGLAEDKFVNELQQEREKIKAATQKEYNSLFEDAKNDYNLKVEKLQEEKDIEVNEIKDSCKKEIESTKLNCSNKIDEIKNQYKEAVEEEKNQLIAQLEKVDDALGQKIEQIKKTNTMYFTCACDRNTYIPCEIDLSDDENVFVCKQCGAVYRVEINAYPVLLSNITANSKISEIFTNEDGIE